jgi:hypothetical protein
MPPKMMTGSPSGISASTNTAPIWRAVMRAVASMPLRPAS